MSSRDRVPSERIGGGVRRVRNLVLMAGGLGAAFAIVVLVTAFLAQLDGYVGRSPSVQEKLFVIALIGIMLLFIALIGTILFLAGYLASTIERQGALARKTDLTRGTLRRAVMESGGPAYLSGFELMGMDLSWTRWLRKGNLSGVLAARASFEAADLCETDLADADLSHATLADADLRGANLTGANLTGANLAGANLIGARLDGAKLGGADLRGAYLKGAVVQAHQLREALTDACSSQIEEDVSS